MNSSLPIGPQAERLGAFELPIERYQLDNGLRVVIQPDPDAALVAVSMTYLTGSASDPPGRSGLAHLCEHLSFLGCPGDAQSDFAMSHLGKLIEDSGGVSDARTSPDRTVYNSTVAPERVDLALWTEARRLLAPAIGLNAATLAREQSILRQEQLQTIDNRPYGRALAELHHLHYSEGHPYRELPIGSPSGVAAATTIDVSEFYARYYRPDNAVLAITGKVKRSKVRSVIERFFDSLEPVDSADPNAKLARDLQADPPSMLGDEAATRNAYCLDQVPYSRVYATWLSPSFGSGLRLLPRVVAQCWVLGRDRPLQHGLVDQTGIARSIGAMTVTLRDTVLLILSATGQKGVAEPTLRQAFLETLDAEIQRGVDHSALAEATSWLRTNHLSSLQNLGKRADLLAAGVGFVDNARALVTDDVRLGEISACEADAFLRSHWTPDRRVTLSIRPANTQPAREPAALES